MAKTREEYQAELAQLRENAENAAKEYNAAFHDGKVKEANDAAAVIEKAIGEYTEIAEMLAFDHCIKSDNPMITAVTLLTFQTIAAKDNKQGEGAAAITVREIVDKEKAIDLKKLHKKVDGGIGADKNWIFMVEQLNMCMTAQRAQDLGYSADQLKDINDSYAMSDIARGIKLGKNPCSNTQMLKSLQAIVTAMLGEGYKATSHDVVFLKSVYAKKGRAALAVSCANHSNFRKYIAEVCHRIVLDKVYTVEFKRAK